ncbi:hypothetical protein Pan258_29750 [Symmachiella dynata]|uniref:Nmad3 family putative nucleotide modification protein n=1 Tax=Symmachiella dynata TaxID=2527995 RepID=UPI00118A5FC1|nr:hypothetical protein [Symmachiella dynata]QDT48928.1 hypothetical protein Pan258_29750 [Symmachiella dynata]
MTRKAVLLRVGIDSGCGGIQSPLFADGSFEFISIPDKKRVSVHKYGNVIGENGRPHSDYFPARKQESVAKQHIHLDPEFEAFTYGDPTAPKRSFRKLERGDFLIFYCGLQEWDEVTGWNTGETPALYIAGYFVVELAGMATEFTKTTLKREFGKNFHVRYPSVFEKQRDDLVLVKGGASSRLLEKAHKISSVGKDRSGKPLKVLSPEMQKVFGTFGGKVSIQRSPPRWVESDFVEKAIKFVNKLK